MKLYFFILIIALSSCRTAQRHLEIANKHKDKAIKKGAVLTTKSDTLFVDNIINDTIIKNDTVFITSTITNTILEAGEVRYITKRDKRKEEKLKERIRKDSVSIEKLKIRKNATVDKIKEKAKFKEKGIKRYWIIPLILLGFVIAVVLMFVIKNIRKWVK